MTFFFCPSDKLRNDTKICLPQIPLNSSCMNRCNIRRYMFAIWPALLNEPQSATETVPVVFGPVRIHKVKKSLWFMAYSPMFIVSTPAIMATAKNETVAVYIIRCNFLQILRCVVFHYQQCPSKVGSSDSMQVISQIRNSTRYLGPQCKVPCSLVLFRL